MKNHKIILNNQNSINLKSAPISNFILYWVSIFLFPFLLLLPNQYSFIFALPFLIIIHYGGHEAIHGCLAPNIKFKKKINFISGAAGFAFVGHNFIFMRWSHLAHHMYGRIHHAYTIDGSDVEGSRKNKFKYYISLLGASYFYHEIAGYLYPIFGEKHNILTKRFKKKYYANATYLAIQFFTLITTVCLFYFGGIKFVICKLLFMVYWGLFQNVAHYGLEIGDFDHSEVAARTYRLPKFVEFLMFKGGGYHLEHHVFPNIPGPNLDNPIIQEQLEAKLGFKPIPIIGLKSYLLDVFKQFYGPNTGSNISKDWRPQE